MTSIVKFTRSDRKFNYEKSHDHRIPKICLTNPNCLESVRAIVKVAYTNSHSTILDLDIPCLLKPTCVKFRVLMFRLGPRPFGIHLHAKMQMT